MSKIYLFFLRNNSLFFENFYSQLTNTVRSSNFLSVPYRTVQQQTVYRSKKYHTIQTDFVLKTQFGVYRSLPKMHFFLLLPGNAETLKEHEPFYRKLERFLWKSIVQRFKR
jgi:hypothetical protein